VAWQAERKFATQSTTRSISCSQHAATRVSDEAGNLIEAHEYEGDFKEWRSSFLASPPLPGTNDFLWGKSDFCLPH
jgi:hypothetical protein